MAKINRDTFFTAVRKNLFGNKLAQGQVDGLTTILDYWDKNCADKDLRWLAYALATTHHETSKTMQPIQEYGGNEYKRNLYDVTGKDPERAKKNGNTTPGDGVKYAGAGYVQLTWKNNYARAGKALGLDLVNKPELVLQAPVSAAIMFLGMTDGWFTGKKFADYFTATKADWRNARRIINGTDKAELIEGYAKSYYAALGQKA